MKMKPVPMLPDEIIRIEEAAHRAGVCARTIRRWNQAHAIGRQSSAGAPLQISVIALEMVMEGNTEALQRLRDNDRAHPDVRRYIDRIGVPL
jgi:hypothetical protein